MRWTRTHLRNFGASVAMCVALACAGGMTVGVIYAERRPPPPRVEVITTAPGRGYAWIPGYWRWDNGDYYWMPGHWERIKHGYTRWEPGHWKQRHHRWIWVEGRWTR